MHCTQSEIDQIVAKLKLLVKECDNNPKDERLSEVIKWYYIFGRCPEHMSMIVLEEKIKEAGKLIQIKGTV